MNSISSYNSLNLLIKSNEISFMITVITD